MPKKHIKLICVDDVSKKCECPSCDRHFNSLKLLELHLRVEHKLSLGCECECGIVFNDTKKANQHMLKHHKVTNRISTPSDWVKHKQ